MEDGIERIGKKKWKDKGRKGEEGMFKLPKF